MLCYNLKYVVYLNVYDVGEKYCEADWNMMLKVYLISADFGIAAQITATIGKRKSFIGTPYWLVGYIF